MVTSLEIATHYFTVYGFITVLILGTIGSIFNLITFPCRTFRIHSCTFYLICSSLFELIFTNYGIIIRLITEYLGDNLTITNRDICKIRNYFAVSLPTTASVCVLLAAFDRCALTSFNVRWHVFSSLSYARRVFAVAVVFTLASSSFLLYFYDLRGGVCAPLPGLQTIVVSVYIAIFTVTVPYGGMMIFGILTWLHIKRLRNQITPSTIRIAHTTSLQRTQHQLIILTFLHGFLSSVLVVMRFTAYSYNIITSVVYKTDEQKKVEYLVQQVSVLLYYINYGMPFYIYYGSSRLFRKQFQRSIRRLFRRYFCCFQRCCIH